MVVVIWIDWYAYHVARLRALVEHRPLGGQVMGIEMVGGVGVHQGLRFREEGRASLPISTLLPESSWGEAGQWRLAQATWRKLRQLDPTVVLVPGYYNLPALAAAVWGRLRGRRTVLMTESTQQDHQRQAWKEGLKSLLLRSLFDWAVAGGKPHVRYLEALGFPPERIARSYDVVDNAFFAREADALRQSTTRERLGLPERYFLFVGRLAPEKNGEGLIEAYARYRRDGGDWSLVLVGDGPSRAGLELLARESGYGDDIRFVGLKGTAELPPYYAFAGCFVLPSLREPWGLVVNEAMASGLPVLVSTACGCAEDLVEEGENGHTFDAASTASLAAQMGVLDALRPAQREAMGQRSREIVARYSPEGWAAEIGRIVGEPAAGRRA